MLSIHTYGYSDAVYYVLQGIAMFTGSPFYDTIINTVAGCTGIYYGVAMAMGNWRHYLLRLFGMLLIVQMLFLQKTSMMIVDHVRRTPPEKVDNLPVVFAFPVGKMEEIGHLITLGFEQAFSVIGSKPNSGNLAFTYYNYGMLFGARLKKEVSQVRFKDPEFVSNMQNFIKRCVIIPAEIGYQFTWKDLADSKDMWKIVSEKAGTLTRTDVSINGTRGSMTCKEAAMHFNEGGSYWDREIERIAEKYLDTDFGTARPGNSFGPANTLSKVFKDNVSALHGNTVPAGTILRQQMMVNSISGYKSPNSSYGVSRAMIQQETAGLLASDIASLTLPMVLVMVKCIIYAAFIFVIPLMLLPKGWSKYNSYLVTVLSLQLWPAINSVINMVMSLYSNVARGSDMLTSFSTASTINNHIDTIVTVAGNMQGAVPFIAYWLTSLGAGGVSQMAGGFLSNLQGSINTASNEVSTGSRSFDVKSENIISKDMYSGFKHDSGRQYFDGANSELMDDGGIRRTNPNGSVVYSGGPGMTTSAGSVRFNTEDNLQNQFSQGIQQSDALVDRKGASYSESKSNTMNKATDFVAQLAQREHEGGSVNYDSLGEQGKSLRQAVNETRALHDRHGYSFNQAGQLTLEAHAKGSTPLKAITGVDIGGGVTGALSASNTSEQSLHNDKSIDRGNHTDQSYSNIVRAASNSNWAKENSLDTRLSDEVRASYAEEKRYAEEYSKAHESSKNWHDAKTRFESSGATMNRDRYDDVMKELVDGKYAGSSDEARQLIESGSPVARKVWNGMVNREFNSFMGNINVGRNSVQGAEASAEIEDSRKYYAAKVGEDIEPEHMEKVQTEMSRNNFRPEEVREEINSAETDLKGKHSHITAENETQISSVRKANEMDERDLKQRADKYEEDRIGQGKASKIIGGITNLATLGRAGQNIGGPDQGEGQDYDHSTRPTASSNVRTFSIGKEDREVLNDSNMLNNSPEITGDRETQTLQNAVNNKPASFEALDNKAEVNSRNINTLKDLPEMTASPGMEQQLEDFKAKTAKPGAVDQGAYQKALNTKPTKEE